jgi:hypothetical protein
MFGIFAMNVGDKNVVAVLDFLVKTIVKVGYPPIKLAQAHGRIVIFVDNFFDKDGEATSAACMDLRRCYVFRLALDLRFGAASRTLWRTSRHPNLLHLPVNLRIVFVESGKAEDHVLLAQQCDCDLGSFGMAFVAQNNVCDLGASACLICGSIDVVDGDGGGETTGG